jgi:hypothetical protein
MFGKNRYSKEDKYNLVRLISINSGYSTESILEAAERQAQTDGEDIMYILRVWESKASCKMFIM